MWAAGAATLLLVGGCVLDAGAEPGYQHGSCHQQGHASRHRGTREGHRHGLEPAGRRRRDRGSANRSVPRSMSLTRPDTAMWRPCCISSRMTAPTSSSPRPAATRRPPPQFAAESGIPVIVYDAPDADGPRPGRGRRDQRPAGRLPRRRAGREDDQDRHPGHGHLGRHAQLAQGERRLRDGRAVGQPGHQVRAPADRQGCLRRPEGGKRTTDQVIAAGADIVFGRATAPPSACSSAVETATPPAGADKVWFIDVIGDKTSIDDQGRPAVVRPVELRAAPSSRPSRTSTPAPSATHGYVQDLANGGIALLQTDNITADAWAAVEAATGGIADGTIVDPRRPPRSTRSRRCTQRS